MSTLQQELKQSRPFSSLEEEAMLSIARTAAMLDHAHAEGFRPFGITPTQYNVLRILRGAGETGLCRNEVRERLIARVPDTTRLLDRLAEMELISRDRDTPDRRFVTTRITQAGLDLLARMDEPVRRMHQEQVGHVPPERLRLLIDILAEVRNRAG
jgi:DNA-binding MarR family transcriptional regulator